MAAAIGQTIAVVDKSGKVVSTSKQLMNVFKEAKMAYRERKAEIIAERHAEKQERAARRDMAALALDDGARSTHSSRRESTTGHSRSHKQKVRPPTERHGSSSSRRKSSSGSPRSPTHKLEFEQDLHSHASSPTRSVSRTSPTSPSHPSTELVRRATDQQLALSRSPPPPPPRSNSASAIDMDLAYGEYYPDSVAPPQKKNQVDEVELSGLVAKAKMLLDEANCAQHSVSAMIAHLQKNPDAMAAVALTLAEISNVASKMAPGALAAMKGSAPAVFALLAAPEFLIAVGVGVGITVVMLGGYKIVKKIKTKRAVGKEGSVDEMMEVTTDLDRIEQWRRGIADAEASSTGTSVEGELITPMAATMKGMPVPDRVGDLKGKKKQKKKSKSEKTSTKSSKSNKTSSVVDAEGKQVIKVKKPSPLRMMFK
ncbi:MAG: hypothetical protein Q9227_002298 [Pyrenula ochraceoflavens]